MIIKFYKYHGAGNDFILIDNRKYNIKKDNPDMIKSLCHRNFGIGADGLMLLNDSVDYDFEMIYFNSNGKEGSMCGNGGRCIVAFAHFLDTIKTKTRFIAVDGPHDAEIIKPNQIKLKINDVTEIEEGADYFYLNTGSPHYVSFRDDIDSIDVEQEGKKIRFNDRFRETGTNVNFVKQAENKLYIRTYERGVESETLACGTGITASSIAASLRVKHKFTSFDIEARGGKLNVSFNAAANYYSDIWLEGPAVQVFEGEISI